jgi:serine/threonine-protein kinase HipA
MARGDPTLTDVIALAAEIGIAKQKATQIIEELTKKCTNRKMLK